MTSAPFGGFYQGKRVLVTGHTGFKGAWLSLWLRELGAEVYGLALDPPTQPNLYDTVRARAFPEGGSGRDGRGDIREIAAVEDALRQAEPELVFHLAAQPLVRSSYEEPLATLSTNVMGTAHMLEALRRRGRPCTAVVVTSDKCYENREWEFAYRENDPLGGHDVYSMSKGASELVAAAWRHSFFQAAGEVRMVTARAGNVIGGGDFARDRIVPDAATALAAGRPVPVRNPVATRPWQHVLECLGGYLWLGARVALAEEGEERRRLESAFNFGPGPGANRPVGELVTEFLRHWPGGRWEDLSGRIGKQPHEAARLNLAIDKADAALGWFPVWPFEETVQRTAAWYHQHAAGGSMLELCLNQLNDYTLAASTRRVAWAV